MYTLFDIENWNRKHTYEFFRTFADPYADVATEIDVTGLYAYCKRENLSFAYATLWIVAKMANEIENFRLRIVGDELRLYDKVHIGQTLGYEDGTYTHCFFQYYDDMKEFCIKSKEHAAYRKSLPKANEERSAEWDMLHTSILRWFSFTSVKNPQMTFHDSFPKINIGKFKKDVSGKLMLPIAISVNHALMDGYQLGLFINGYQKIASQYE